MSQERPIWNDGQGLSTPDLQRSCNDVGAVDDRVQEVLLTPGSLQKRILPLYDESATQSAPLLAIPSAVGLSPVGVNGAVRLMPSQLVAGSPTSTQQVALSATLYAPLDSATIAANSSGSIRYDLIYATVVRSVSVTGTRKIKSATDGTLSSQTVNLADAPSVTIGVVPGFLTGATPPTAGQIAAALPADTAPSSSTFGSFNFAIAVVTVANGYASGTTLSQNSAGGTSYLTQVWTGGHVRRMRLKTSLPSSIVGSGINEAVASSASTTRTGVGVTMMAPVYMLPSTKNVGSDILSTWPVFDNSIDWRRRFITVTAIYVASASGSPTPESNLNGISGVSNFTAPSSSMLVGLGGNLGLVTPTPAVLINYVSGAGFIEMVVGTDGVLRFARSGATHDGSNGDLVMIQVTATDQFLLNS